MQSRGLLPSRQRPGKESTQAPIFKSGRQAEYRIHATICTTATLPLGGGECASHKPLRLLTFDFARSLGRDCPNRRIDPIKSMAYFVPDRAVCTSLVPRSRPDFTTPLSENISSRCASCDGSFKPRDSNCHWMKVQGQVTLLRTFGFLFAFQPKVLAIQQRKRAPRVTDVAPQLPFFVTASRIAI